MADDDTSTAETGSQDPDASASADASGDATTAGPDEVSVLKSRYAGQTAKVNELSAAKAALEAQLAADRQELAKLRSGEADKDATTQAVLKAKDEELAQARREAALARIEAKYPETYAELGEAAVSLTEDRLASMEARLQGAGFEGSEPPTPRGQNAARKDSAPAGKKEDDESFEDVVARLEGMAVPEEWTGGFTS